MRLFVLLSLLCLSGCYRNVGPVVVNVSQGADGLHYTRCDLVVGQSVFTIGWDSLESCKDERGSPVAAPQRR